MAKEEPLGFEEVLADEYRSLRPDSGIEAGSEKELFAAMHRDKTPLRALCISGGGIRSATFALGVIQGLAERGVLPLLDYLSTVSGGGYIGGWLTAWKRRAGGIDEVVPRLRRGAPPPEAGEADPIRHLRQYNHYLAPHAGAFSTDLWTLIATILRNILLNWMVLIPLLMFGLMLPRLYLTALAFPEHFFAAEIYEVANPPDWEAKGLNRISNFFLVRWVLPVLSIFLVAMAMFFTLRYLPGLGGRDHSRYDFSVKILVPMAGAVLTYLAFDSLYYLGDNFKPYIDLWTILLWMLVPCAAAWLLFLLTHRGRFLETLRLLFGPMSLAVLAMAAGTAVSIWVVTNFVLWDPNPEKDASWAEYVTAGPPAVLLGFIVGSLLFVGLSSLFLKDEGREWMSRAMGSVLLYSAAWAGVCAMVLVLPQWALGWRTWGQGALAAVTALSGWLSILTPSSPGGAGTTEPARGRMAPLLSLASRVAPVVFLGLLACGLAVLTNIILFGAHKLVNDELSHPDGTAISWSDHYGVLEQSDPAVLGVVTLVFLLIGMLMARFININTFSLHGMYRDRLVRAYLGASNNERRASGFTGFAANDDMPMNELDPGQRPFHVLNLALNLVGGSRLAWQQRKAASFTMAPLHCGSRDVGYRPSSGYGGGISLGSAVALSGAAASPNMGYHSSPVIGFIMTLFNARLGSWLGNPGPPGRWTWRHPGPLSAVRSLIKESLGQTSDKSEYVYLSDGGHFENLGLYEMIARRCRQIVVIDGGCDPNFHLDDLGNAMRKIRIDFGIPIVFSDQFARPLKERRKRCMVGTIRYSVRDGEGTDGQLIYIKPMLSGTEGPDVASYAAAHPHFPHQSTADQSFDESQTESYRALGLHTVDEICGSWRDGSLDDLCRHIETEYLFSDPDDATESSGN